MEKIIQLIESLRERSDSVVDNCVHSWRIGIKLREDQICEVIVPHNVLEWYASVRILTEKKEIWSDWMDYEGYDDRPKEALAEDMARDINNFMDRVKSENYRFPPIIFVEEHEKK